ncbi:MAG: NUDIX hydrolase [Planctomycetia bacterium]|nr:NUDIX hydrolase [Planctomycetia bacterium]
MMPEHANRPRRESLAVGRFVELVREGHWEYAHRINTTGAAVIVAVTADDCLLLVEQYRIPVGQRVIELPAGLVGDSAGDEGESIEAAARRELVEETGYDAIAFHRLTSGPPSAGMSSEVATFVLATGLSRVGDGGGVHREEITVHAVPLVEAAAWLQERERHGVLVDPKVYAGLYFAEHARA